MAGSRGLPRLWQPPPETLEAMGAVLGEHWRAAATSGSLRLYRPAPSSWLRVESAMTVYPVRVHHFAMGGRLMR
jgi:hypothetical protein